MRGGSKKPPGCIVKPWFNYHIHPSSMVTGYRVKYTDFQLENIISGILYNQILIDRDSCSDSCSDMVGYFYDVATGCTYKNSASSRTDLFTGIETS